MYRTDFWTLWEKAIVWCSERIVLKQAYYQGWNRSPAQVGCMRQVLRAGALGRPRGMGWGGRREGGSGWGTHVNLCVHVNVWQKPLQYCKEISLQLIKVNEKQNKQTKNKVSLPHNRKAIKHWHLQTFSPVFLHLKGSIFNFVSCAECKSRGRYNKKISVNYN